MANSSLPMLFKLREPLELFEQLQAIEEAIAIFRIHLNLPLKKITHFFRRRF